jgi:hypothetical protein
LLAITRLVTVLIAENTADIYKAAEASSHRNKAQNLLTATLDYQRCVVRQRASTRSSSSGRFDVVSGKE